MNDLIEKLLPAIGPEVTEKVQSQFGLSPEAADKVLPGVAELVIDGLSQQGGDSGSSDLLGTITSLARKGGAEDDGTFIEQFFGGNLSTVVSSLAGKIGVDDGTSRGILQAVVPIVLSYFAKSAEQEGLGGLLSMFGGNSKDIAGDLLNNAGGVQGLIGKLGGFFRKG